MVYDVVHLLLSGTEVCILSSVPESADADPCVLLPLIVPRIDVHDRLKPWIVSAMFHACGLFLGASFLLCTEAPILHY
jgi:hypothetical protein